MVGLSVGDLVITVTSVTSVSTLTSAQTSLLVELGKITLSLSQQRVGNSRPENRSKIPNSKLRKVEKFPKIHNNS